MKQHLLAVGLAALGALAAAGCDVKVNDQGVSVDIVEGRASDEWTRTYTLPKGGRLEIVNLNGRVHVLPSTTSAVEVRVEREVRTRSDESAQQLLKTLTILEEVTPDRVRVETPQASDDAVRGFGRSRITTEYRVSVPAGLHVSVKAENGEIRVENVQAALTLENTNGGFRGRGLAGSVDARTVNGRIDLDFAQVTGDVRATTVNGPIRLGVPAGVNAALEAAAVNGGVTVDDNLSLTTTDREQRRVTGRLGAGGPTIALQTTNGPIRVRVSDGAPADRDVVARERESR